jgi:O-antigen/teichoic acid export membrane protein
MQSPVVPASRTGPTGIGRFVDPTARQGLVLIANAVVTALLGVVYWGVAARRLPLEAVGGGTATISAVTMISGLAQLNLFTSMSVLIPGTAPGRRSALVRRIYLTTVMLTVVGAAAVAYVSPSVLGGATTHWMTAAAWAVPAAAMWTLFALQGGALIAVRATGYVLAFNAGFGAAKLALLFILPSDDSSGVVLWSWYAPLIVFVPLANVVLFLKLKNDRTPVEHSGSPRFTRFVAIDYAGFLVVQIMTTALPVYVATMVGAESAAVFATCWMVSTALDLAAGNFAIAMSVSIARNPQQASQVVQSLAPRMTGLLLLLVGTLIAAASPILDIFGEEYTKHGVTILRLLLIGCIFRAVVTFCSATARSLRRPGAVIVMQLVAAVVVLAGGLPAMQMWGITALALAWALGQLLAAGAGTAITVLLLRRTSGTARTALPVPA